MRQEWFVLAQADRNAIFDYIETDSPQAAVNVDERIRMQVEGLLRFPESGRPGRIDGTRQLVIDRTLYIAAYRIAGDTVRILRLLHGAREWPRGYVRRAAEVNWRHGQAQHVILKYNLEVGHAHH